MNLMERLKAYKFRIYSTQKQELFFGKSFGCVRKVYNPMLDDRMKAYEKDKQDSSKKMKFPIRFVLNVGTKTVRKIPTFENGLVKNVVHTMTEI